MSEVNTYKGKLKSTEKTFDNFMDEVEFPDNYDKNDSEDRKWLFYELGDYALIDNVVYEVVEKEDLQYESIFQAERLPNNEISFLVQYYNGSCGFHEAIEEAIKNMEKE